MSDIKRVIAVGFFDGVHRGHAKLLEKTKQRAAELGVTSAVMSFDLHPDTLVHGTQFGLINSAAGRVDIIERLFNIDNVLLIHFSEETRHMAWRDFLDTLCSEFGAVHIVVGFDFRFGYKGEGNVDRLEEYCAETGIGCDIIPQVCHNCVPVSSTYIRSLISEGDIERANDFLGHPYTLLDTVQYGYRLGQKIGAPTINMRFPDGVLVPKYGVYASCVYLEDGPRIAVTNVGVRPTVSGENRVSVESYILGFSGNLYGKQVRVEFYKFLRSEQEFENVEQLKAQIQADAAATISYFETYD